MFTCKTCRKTASCRCAFARLDQSTRSGLCKVCAAQAQGLTVTSVPLDVRMELSNPNSQPDELPVALEMCQSAGGVGDAVCGMYAAAGLAGATGQTVHYYTRHPWWLERVQHPQVIVHGFQTRAADCFTGGYDTMLREEVDRKQWYCDNVARALGIATFQPVAPGHLDTTLRTGTREIADVLLFPLTAWKQRQWPTSHWRRLALGLRQSGLRVVALGGPEDGPALREMWSDFPDDFHFYWGQEPDWIIDAMLEAKCVVGNDSGMAHVAGLFEVPCVAIHAQHTPQTLFSTTQVKSAYAATACAGCAWQENRGWNFTCQTGCSALASITPETVATMIKDQL